MSTGGNASGHWAWLFDIGSTFTKLTVVDLEDPTETFRGQSPTTVATDVQEGFFGAVASVEGQQGPRGQRAPRFADAAYRAASSSAAGGLAMVVSGLVPRLSAEAGRIAALGAGAKLTGCTSGRLIARDIESLARSKPDIVLLTGGTDGGDKLTLLHNAQALGRWTECPAVIVAGNREVADDAADILVEAGIPTRVVPNILPEIDVLEVGPAREAIRDEFLTNIVRAKGISRVQEYLDTAILPTPGVVLAGVELMAERLFTDGLIAIEIGGATTNIHSWSSSAVKEGVIQRGLVEPALKRTVEGDLGVRWNAGTILEQAGDDFFVARGIDDVADLHRYVAAVGARPETLPATDSERDYDAALACFAAKTAIARHCGRQREVSLPTGTVLVQEGKDLTRVGTLLGTGGSLIAAADPAAILSPAITSDDPFALLPSAARCLVDRDYVLYTVGLLAESNGDVGIQLAEQSLEPIPSLASRR
jgi:uncharacterized protein (TIGR01319 family)